MKIYLQPGASVDRANSQVVALSGFILRLLPPATQPPEIINFSASSVPVLQLGVSGPGMSEQQLNDLALNFLRTQLITDRIQNVVRGVLVSVLKAGTASTLDVVAGIRKVLPRAALTLPPQLKVTALADQSLFVRSAIDGVVREAIIAAALTGVMILLFIGSWRSTLIIAISIPLSILSSILVLSHIRADHAVAPYADFPKAHNVAKQAQCLGGERLPGEAGALIERTSPSQAVPC